MSENAQKSDVEKYWDAVRAEFGNTFEWHQLTPNQQQAIIHSINILIGVLYNEIR